MSEAIEALNLEAWVAKAQSDKKHFREAVHIILTAIGASTALRTKMVMKGGMLMALRYDSSRFTKDADFSTKALYAEGDEKELLAELDARLALANNELPYDTECRIQRFEIRPARSDKTFPTLSVNIGYVPRSNEDAMRRLLAKQSSTVVAIDYSYNEAVLDVDVLQLKDGDELQVYSLVNLMAEKYRSLLQQPTRRRNRRQDVYDLSLLLAEVKDWTKSEIQNLRDLIVLSAKSRGIEATVSSMRDPKVKQMAAEGYEEMRDEVDGSLPEFSKIYQDVLDFYEGLPW